MDARSTGTRTRRFRPATSSFDATKPKNLFHTMNAEISGPIIFKDRTFFLFSWSGLVVAQFHL